MTIRDKRITDSTGAPNAGLRAAVRALKHEKRKPTDADRPPPTPFPGRRVKPLPGQLDLAGNEIPGVTHDNPEDADDG
jgi:hypothetical protein